MTCSFLKVHQFFMYQPLVWEYFFASTSIFRKAVGCRNEISFLVFLWVDYKRLLPIFVWSERDLRWRVECKHWKSSKLRAFVGGHSPFKGEIWAAQFLDSFKPKLDLTEKQTGKRFKILLNNDYLMVMTENSFCSIKWLMKTVSK